MSPGLFFDKVYGMNRLFKSFSSGRYHERGAVVERSPDNEILDRLWEQAFGQRLTVQAGTPTWTSQLYNMFWLPRNHRQIYRGTRPNSVVESNGSGRQALNGSAILPAFGIYITGEPSYVASSNGTFAGAYDANQAMSRVFDDLRRGRSIVYGVPLNGPQGRAMFIKPLGIDDVFVNYYDESLFRLEAVVHTDRDGQRRIVVMTPGRPNGQLAANNDLSGPFQLGPAFDQSMLGSLDTQLDGHGTKAGNISFQLRRLSDNAVSPIASGQVRTIHRNRWVPHGFIVSNDHT